MKPMLLSNEEFDLNKLDYSNMYIAKKRDGIRAEVTNEGIKNRSLKNLRNVNVQEWFKELYTNLPEGIVLEGEIYADSTPCREMAGICNSLNHDVPSDTKLYVFGIYDPSATFEERVGMVQELNDSLPETMFLDNRFEIVDQVKVSSEEEVNELYMEYLEQGLEGAVLMDGSKKYKNGRVTINQHIGFKLKPHREDDLIILSVQERMKNENESEKNELGRSFKRNTVADKTPTGIAATFNCRMDSGEETKVTITGTEAERRKIWELRAVYIGKYVTVLSMDYGVKDRLRHPRMIGIKEKVEK